MKKILLLSNRTFIVWLELEERLLREGHEVWILSPSDYRDLDIKNLGCHHVDIKIKRHDTNPMRDLALMRQYKKRIKEIAPDIVFSHTIKPNIYGAIACRSLHVPCVVNVSGLGTAVGHKGLEGRAKVEKIFDRQIVVEKYMRELECVDN